MTHILAIANQKGGVGKTTTTVNLAASLAKREQRVLLIDSDPQGNATAGSGIDKHGVLTSLNDVLLGEVSVEQAIVSTEAGFDLLPSNSDLTIAEVGLLQMEAREQCLKQALTELHDYDYILIDCPPSLNLLTLNALVAAQSVLIPMQCEYFALEGLTALMETIERVRTRVNPTLEIEGVLRTMFDGRNSLAQQVSEQLSTHFGDKVYQTIIPRNVRLAEAPSFGTPALQYDRYSPGAVAYLNLADEMIEQHEAQEKELLAKMATLKAAPTEDKIDGN